MKSFAVCQEKCPELLPSNIGGRISGGADGEVFGILDDYHKVIKFSIAPSDKKNEVIPYLLKYSDPICAKIYDYKYLGTFNSNKYHDYYSDIGCFSLYYYIMERLYHLTEDEEKVLYTIFSHEDRGIIKKYRGDELKKILSGLTRGLDFDEKKVRLFAAGLESSVIEHNDLDPRNIMKDHIGNFKLIDFDRSTIKDNIYD